MRVRLKEQRIKRVWTQSELSQRSGVPQPMISEIESGSVRDPRISTVYALAKALHCYIEDFIEEDNASHD